MILTYTHVPIMLLCFLMSLEPSTIYEFAQGSLLNDFANRSCPILLPRFH